MSPCVAFLVDLNAIGWSFYLFFSPVHAMHMSVAWRHISHSYWCPHLDISAFLSNENSERQQGESFLSVQGTTSLLQETDGVSSHWNSVSVNKAYLWILGGSSAAAVKVVCVMMMCHNVSLVFWHVNVVPYHSVRVWHLLFSLLLSLVSALLKHACPFRGRSE